MDSRKPSAEHRPLSTQPLELSSWQRGILTTMTTVFVCSGVSVSTDRLFNLRTREPIPGTGYLMALLYRNFAGVNKATIYTTVPGAVKDKRFEHSEIGEVDGLQKELFPSASVPTMMATSLMIGPVAAMASFYPGAMSTLSSQNQKIFAQLQEYTLIDRLRIVFGVGRGNRSFNLPGRFGKESIGAVAYMSTELLQVPLDWFLPSGCSLPGAVMITGTVAGAFDAVFNKINNRIYQRTTMVAPLQFTVPRFSETWGSMLREQGARNMVKGFHIYGMGNTLVYGVVRAVPLLINKIFPETASKPSQAGMYGKKGRPASEIAQPTKDLDKITTTVAPGLKK